MTGAGQDEAFTDAIAQIGSGLGFAAFAAIPALVFPGIRLLNHRAAAMLRKQIERLDAATSSEKGESE